MKLHVANLSPKVTEGLLRELFGQFGEVVVLKLSWTRAVNRTAGTAVVEMGSAVEERLMQVVVCPEHRLIYKVTGY